MKKKLSLRELQIYELNILKSFVTFCENHHLRYYLAGGTLLGAIRHQGFIPWDDDIDVLMPRNDYEKFVRLHHDFEQQSSGRYTVHSNRLKNLNHVFCKILDRKTFVKNEFTDDPIEKYLWIDILPLDGLPSDEKEVKKIYKRLNTARMILRVQRARVGAGQTFLKKLTKPAMKFIFNLYGKDRTIKFIDSYSQRYSLEESDYVGAVAMGLYGPGERMPKADYLEPVKVHFEGLELAAPKCWDYYLTSLYGNYMELPPKDKQGGHYIEAWVEE
ncbi:LicD family protein [Streptococcus devriesei]|uniref:LicD family protein n=1 Tax=Streptococcus devriesei TaxID=231233 RepID=UPI0003FA4636|nr:LicD family protein [Streptococcus devriesei]